MKVLISNAVWGESYCATFTRLSLASLLAPENLPRLAKTDTLTYHIVTTRRDHERLAHDQSILELQRYCSVEWELLEDYGIYQPPTGAGGEKYPFLSALQNIAIRRSLDYDAVVFNYADFIWADGSITEAVDLLQSDTSLDAVLGFCMPVDRDRATVELERYRQASNASVVNLSPRAAAKVIVEHLHREARIRIWDNVSFTNLPTYLIWKVADQGLLVRAYHHSILAMRVRPQDPKYARGIVRGSLDASLTAELAKNGSVACATDAEKVLIFSLYHTPVDSRLPPGETRETSLRSVLRADVTPPQRAFAQHPIQLRLRDGEQEFWDKAIKESWSLLQEKHESVEFDQAAYDANYETHGLIPTIARQGPFKRAFARAHAGLVRWSVFVESFAGRPQWVRTCFHILARPSEMRNSRRMKAIVDFMNRTGWICRILLEPARVLAGLRRRVLKVPSVRSLSYMVRSPTAFARSLRHALTHVWLRSGKGFEVAPNLWIDFDANADLGKAIAVEDSAARAVDDEHFAAALRAAEVLLRKAIKAVPVWPVPRRALGRNLWFQGRFDEAMHQFAVAEESRDALAWAADYPVDACVVLPRNCAEGIGLMGHLEAFVKHKILTKDERPYYLIAPRENVVNDAFLSYWRDYITTVSEPNEIGYFSTHEQIYGVDWNWAMPCQGTVVFAHQGMAAVQRSWRDSGRSHLLNLRPEHRDALARARVKWGIAPSERFVCLHIRSSGFYGESREHAQRFRNTALDDYYPLIRALNEMGLWVVRMGDPSMSPLDMEDLGKSSMVVDYARSNDKSSELDVALCAECELFVSSPSGLHTVAHAFGRPVCEVNYPIYPGFPWHPGDIFIPQLYYSNVKGRVLSLREILGSDVVHRDHHFLLERAGITLLPNQPDEIVETVREALSPSTYSLSNLGAADKVCANFDELNQEFKVGISGKIGRYFAAKYADKLTPR